MDWEVPTTRGIIDLALTNPTYARDLVDAIEKEMTTGWYAAAHVVSQESDIPTAYKNKPRHTVIKSTAVSSVAKEILLALDSSKNKHKKMVRVITGKISSENLGDVSFNLTNTVQGWDYQSGKGGAATIRSVELTGISISEGGKRFNFHFVPRTFTV